MAYEDLNTKFIGTDKEAYSNTLVLQSKNEIYPTVANADSIKAGLERLLMTPKGHDPFNREYGNSLYTLLFKTNVAVSDVQMLLYMDITNWEPRIEISPADIKIVKKDNNTFVVYCTFRIPETNLSNTISTTIVKE